MRQANANEKWVVVMVKLWEGVGQKRSLAYTHRNPYTAEVKDEVNGGLGTGSSDSFVFAFVWNFSSRTRKRSVCSILQLYHIYYSRHASRSATHRNICSTYRKYATLATCDLHVLHTIYALHVFIHRGCGYILATCHRVANAKRLSPLHLVLWHELA